MAESLGKHKDKLKARAEGRFALNNLQDGGSHYYSLKIFEYFRIITYSLNKIICCKNIYRFITFMAQQQLFKQQVLIRHDCSENILLKISVAVLAAKKYHLLNF